MYIQVQGEYVVVNSRKIEAWESLELTQLTGGCPEREVESQVQAPGLDPA